MIISDKYKFVFVHIPKCGGSSIRKRLESIDGIDSSFYGISDHPELGKIDLTHLPLSILQKHFVEAFDKIKRYESFAVLRDPFQRFPSSVIQRLRLYGATPVEVLSGRDIAAAVDEIIEFLSDSRSTEILPHDFSHFHRQRGFVFNDGVQIVRELFPLSDISTVFARLAELVDAPVHNETAMARTHENKSESFVSDLSARVAARLLPFYTDSVKRRLPTGLRRMLRQRFLVDLASKYEDVFTSNHVMEFVGDYYCEDIELFEHVSVAAHRDINGG